MGTKVRWLAQGMSVLTSDTKIVFHSVHTVVNWLVGVPERSAEGWDTAQLGTYSLLAIL